MITLALFNQIADDKVAGLTKNEDFFWEEAPLQKDGKPTAGVWLITRGGDASASPQSNNLSETVDFYVAYNNKAKTEATQQAILSWLIQNKSFCSLTGSAGDIEYKFENVRIFPTTTPQNSGVTENGLIVKVASAQIIYDLTT